LLPQGSIVIPGTSQDLAAMVARDIVRLGQVKESGAKSRSDRVCFVMLMPRAGEAG
jgi:hypothetical protein